MRLLTSLIAASLCVGGFAHGTPAVAEEPTCHIILFGKRNLEPGQDGFRIIFQDVPDLERHDFNNKVSSFVILKGRWRFYRGRDYNGDKSKRVGPGLYADMEAVGMENNKASSLRCRDD